MTTREKLKQRSIYIIGFFVLGALVLVFKAAHLQLINNKFGDLAKSTMIERQVSYPSRGLIYDRNGELLVLNEGLYDIDVIYNNIDPHMDTAFFCQLLGIDKETFVKNLEKDWTDIRYAKYAPFTFLTKVSAKRYLLFAENKYQFPGFIPRLRNIRGYTHNNAAHILGYISEVNKQILQDSGEIYKIGDYIGTSGLEAYYESRLRGEKGVRYNLKDKWGNNVGSFDGEKFDSSAISGENLTISIDLPLQVYLESLFQGKKGAAVVIQPNTGEILAIVSSPTYDPKLLMINRRSKETLQLLAQDTLKPFYERSIKAKYPPGSTLKPIMALIGLQEGIISADERRRCAGGYHYNNFRWGCHCGGGSHNVTSAIRSSCNTYFFGLYRELVDEFGPSHPELGLRNINNYLRKMGLGKRLGVDLNYEGRGLIPEPQYYDDLYPRQKGEWRSTYIISNGVGQGEIEVTTLQLANLAAILANRGWYKTPHLLKEFRNTEEQIPTELRKGINVGIDRKHFDPVIQGLINAVEFGTGRLAQVPNITVAGKTGTSENPHGSDHSVFMAFAPVEKPEIAIAVFVENAGYGSQFAAPIAGLAIEKYLNDTISNGKKWIEQRMLDTNFIVP